MDEDEVWEDVEGDEYKEPGPQTQNTRADNFHPNTGEDNLNPNTQPVNLALNTRPNLASNIGPDNLSSNIGPDNLCSNIGSDNLGSNIGPDNINPNSQPTNQTAYSQHRFSRQEEAKNYNEELKFIKGMKVICSLDLLLQEFAGQCRRPGCCQKTTVDHKLVGTSATVYGKCPLGHKGRFSTSEFDGNGMAVNNLQAAASALLSGNNFAKIEQFAKFLGLSFISSSTFYRVQRAYCIPAIDEWWQWMRDKLIAQFTDEETVLSGDGQCDSPGFSAKNLCYFLMEVVSGYILEVEILDKRLC